MAPITAISYVSNVFIRQMTFVKAGDVEPGHVHAFDHITLLASGRLRLDVPDGVHEFKAPQHIFIKAGVKHKMTALENGTVAHCIHAIRDGDLVGDIIDPESVPVFSTQRPASSKSLVVGTGVIDTLVAA